MSVRIEPVYDADVVVCGAGPAGAATATHLARLGLDVVVVDRQAFPRDKVCGDFVGPAALRELKALGVSTRQEFREGNVIHDAALFLDGKKLISQSIPEVSGLPSFGRCIPRSVLDDLILDAGRAAGVRVFEQFRLNGFTTTRSGVTVALQGPDGIRQLQARLLIGADGSNSLTARILRGQRPAAADRIIAVRAYFEEVEGPPDQADIYFTAESFPGYYWLFPTGKRTANVGIGMMLETLPPTQDRLQALLQKLLKEDKALRQRLGRARMTSPPIGWPLTTYNPREAVTGAHVLLVGDAAGLINPLNGEGIQYALLSGRWAAEAVAECAKERDFSAAALARYADRLGRELRYDMALANLVVQFIRNRSLNPVWLQALRIICARARRDFDYAHVVGGILAGLVPASDAVSAKILLGTLEQAVVSTGVSAVLNVVRGPAHLAARGKDAARMAAEVAFQTATNPVGVLNWGLGLATGTAELAMQVGGHWLERRR